jgi:hypothetical protein
MGEFELVDHGLTVYQDDQPIEGPVRWLNSPASVITDLVDQGQHEYLASPNVDTVHTVWMELHEDYLLTQDINREQEGSF